MKRKWNDLTDEEKAWAKERYLEYKSIMSIADELNVPRTSVQYHASNHWNQEREMLKAELFASFTSAKKAVFIQLSEKSLSIIEKALAHIVSRQCAPSTKEAKDAVQILEALDKIGRLDEGKPTEILEEKIMDMKDIQDIASLVPFKIEDNKDKEGKQ